MYIVPIAWLYVALMMSVAEATSTEGTLLGASITFLLYGVLPISLVLYIMGTPARKRAKQAKAPLSTHPAFEPDASGETPTDSVTTVRKEP